MVEYLAKSEDLTAVADAIRAKGGTDAQLTFPDGFTAAIQAIGSGNHGIIARDVITATESMTIFEVLNAVEVKCTYKTCYLNHPVAAHCMKSTRFLLVQLHILPDKTFSYYSRHIFRF